MTPLPKHRTRIVCTIGPASGAPRTLERMIRRGMDVARLNLAHGDFESHRATITAIRAAADRVGRRVTLLADLPGPKLRVGRLGIDSVELKRGQLVRLVALDGAPSQPESMLGCEALAPSSAGPGLLEIPLTLPSLPASLKPGDDIFLNDGLIQLRMLADAPPHGAAGASPIRVAAPARDSAPRAGAASAQCHAPAPGAGAASARSASPALSPVSAPGTAPGATPLAGIARVLVGGVLHSRDGISLPGIDLGISAFTERDRELLAFALGEGVEAVGVSFVQDRDDVIAVREASASLGFDPFIIAKIERARAVERIEEILHVTDGLMVARGDLGVNIPIERIGVAQKLLISKANAAGRPVITATQMLESMTEHRRPTRAEVTDVTNAILDGTDCVMLSEETAMGRFPVEAVAVMSRIADSTERNLHTTQRPPADATSVRGVLTQEAAATAEQLNARYIVVPTETGTTARTIARLRPRAWIVAFSPFQETCQRLQFSRGVHPVFAPEAAHVRMAGTPGPGEPGGRVAPRGASPVAAPPILPPTSEHGLAVTCEEVDWQGIARRWFREQALKPGLVVVIQGNNRLEVIDLTEPPAAGDPEAGAPDADSQARSHRLGPRAAGRRAPGARGGTGGA